MKRCSRCGSYAKNHHNHGRDGSDADLCDVCYWRKRAEFGGSIVTEPLADEQIDAAIQQHVDPVATYRKLHNFARAIEAMRGIKKGDSHG